MTILSPRSSAGWLRTRHAQKAERGPAQPTLAADQLAVTQLAVVGRTELVPVVEQAQAAREILEAWVLAEGQQLLHPEESPGSPDRSRFDEMIERLIRHDKCFVQCSEAGVPDHEASLEHLRGIARTDLRSQAVQAVDRRTPL